MAFFGVSSLIGVIVGLLMASIVVHLAAKLSGVEDPTFGKAVVAFIASGIVTKIISSISIFSVAPVIGFFVSLFFASLILKSIYKTRWDKALLIWVIYYISYYLCFLILN